ncbi:2,3-bisphosphoglycerate-independent phosphoglycerate mutase [Candidatus Berkelbacteria bacterium CG_4_9_14_0_2_um_filter_42_30]|uniref:2,3-bisphosphoglycerate-independent phosphoglycerate mutase n=4 Tax=Candidatus Berkelbacteria TaxID=1618330 RepID=A0A2H0AZN3_9BACT|nr:MAG: phosphoglycerate mutase (2,3-diphosphoglycerate-independent) [Candidatus Berkelbacteria bacterium CG1_02_42_45]PIP50876.1 MAG: phosphoglycerate mutase (2,3-diphosphoglycerate-independent) [Candidatus Berkelbacteria bacterium CG23_combo_of_CG06-09_8_20_14_all_41_73]PIR27579.1 MAG: phosphoglycerate mutase (2,3-diphosphoglycerate-independent) [Candidatus Berkelbacteria bacterium CG11_big_fil_rev_8_21_14_0_20_42_15]PJC65561.1 MAG: 2,3-bisphosphoglycerate-independent phosphoglycerate mutase [
MREKARVALIVLDGWGLGPPWGGNAITAAKTSNMDYFWRNYCRTTLVACGEAVGLPSGTSGNSETGHLNIGAGRIVPQDLPYINTLIKDGQFFKNPRILAAFEQVKKNNSRLHLMGLVGFGRVHSDMSHLFALLKMARDNDLQQVYLDLFTDGRDSDPSSALSVLELITNRIQEIGIGRITTICGRYFAMDRDRNWGRTSRAYNALTKGEAEVSPSIRDVISRAYLRNITDEYIKPHLIVGAGQEKVLVGDNDAVIFFNFRPDRARQITRAFTTVRMPELPDRKILSNLYFLTFVNREPNPLGTPAFEPHIIKNTLAEVVSHAGLRQFHIAETEKYAHVTYFINGGCEEPFPGELQYMVPSPKVPTYDFTPAMSAAKITAKIVSVVWENFDLIIGNYANADMVGHVGNFYAAVQAIEFVDLCLGKITNALLKNNYVVFITADHGNAEEMLNPRTNQPQTEHTSNPVPLVIVSKDISVARLKLKPGGALSNIAPTILEIMGLEKPPEMTAISLIGS